MAQTIQKVPSESESAEDVNLVKLQDFVDYYSIHKGEKASSQYVVPVVVHIIHNNGPENISDQEIIDAIDILNDQYRGNFGGVDTDVQFKLAGLDPDGNCTNGITRTLYAKPKVVDEGAKLGYVSPQTIHDLIRWPTDQYMNIWIVKEVSGYRNYPDGPQFIGSGMYTVSMYNAGWNEESDGVIIEYSAIGEGVINGVSSSSALAYASGRYLNLISVWGLASITNACCLADEEGQQNFYISDFINDTPACNYYSFNNYSQLQQQMASCTPLFNCNNNSWCTQAQPNPSEFFPKDNYMSFNWACSNKFTIGQANWIWNAIDAERPVLCSFSNLISTGVLEDISSSTIWNASDFLNGTVYIGQSIHIDEGAVLTLNEGLIARFSENAAILIHPGGKLVVNGAILTNHCSDYWQGIEVWGKSQERQLSSLQGTIDLKNGAVIEHAACGIRLGKLLSNSPWVYDWGSTGGIVKSTNSSFENNRKDVEFLAYQNYQVVNGDYQPRKNVSYFYDTEFLVDEPLPEVSDLSQRVSLYDVDGIRFRSCNFHIEGNALSHYSIEKRGVGLYSKISSFEVGSKCAIAIPLGSECDPGYLTAETLGEPDSDIIPSRFSNYLTAIRSIGADGFANTSVSGTIFTGNEMGIFVKAVDQASIYRNRFFIDEQDYFIAYGASLVGCTGYKVERNVFEGTGDLDELNTGIWISDSNEESNEIYLNDFRGLFAGSLAQGDQTGGFANLEGLEMLCGLYDNGKYNLSVTMLGQEHGLIGLRQGNMATDDDDVTAPAGNLFTQTNWGSSAPFTDYFICPEGDCAPIIYEHHNEASVWPVVPIQLDPLQVETSDNLPLFTSRQAACPIDKGITHTPGHLHSLVLVKRLEIEAIKGELEGLIDGGNTLAVQSFVNNANNSSAGIRANLLPLTPYLSDDVLRDLLTRQPALNPWHLSEILIACSPLKPDMLIEVENANLLSDFLFGLLTEYQSGTNGLVSKESALKQAELEKANALNSFIRTRITEDDENYYLEEVKELMTGDDIKREIRKKVAILRQENDLTGAAALLSNYDEDSTSEVWKQVMEVLLSIDYLGGYHAATPTQIATLETLAMSGKYGNQHASALIEVITGEVPFEEYNLPGGGGGLKTLTMRESIRRPSLVGVYPNPAQGEFYITYVLPTERKSAFVRVFDLQGKLIQTENITTGFGILSLNAKHFAAGTYVFELELNEQKVATDKFQIVE